MIRGVHNTYDMHEFGQILSYNHYQSYRESMFRFSRGYDDLQFNLDVLKESEPLAELNENMYFITFRMDYDKLSKVPLMYDNYFRADALALIFFEVIARDFSDNILDATIITGDDYYYDHNGDVQVQFLMPTIRLILKDVFDESIVETKIADIYAHLGQFGFIINDKSDEEDIKKENKEEDTNYDENQGENEE